MTTTPGVQDEDSQHHIQKEQVPVPKADGSGASEPAQEKAGDGRAPPAPSDRWPKAAQLFHRTRGDGAVAKGLSDVDIERFRSKIRSAKGVSDEITDELAAIIGLAGRIRSCDHDIPDAGTQIDFIIDCLLAEKPLLGIARDERIRLQLEFYRRSGAVNRFLASISAGSSAGLVLTALFVSLVLWTAVVAGVRWTFDRNIFSVAQDIFFMNGRALAVITSAAFIGGVISIATRLREFSRVRDLDPFAMFWTALLKPLIGVTLSLFILAALAGGVISFGLFDKSAFDTIETERARAAIAVMTSKGASPEDLLKATVEQVTTSSRTLYILWVFGFLAGFSERFAWDFVDRAQGVASAAGSDRKPA